MPTSNIKRYLVALEVDVKATRLKKQLIKWLLADHDNHDDHDKNFTYRFTGKDSRLILHGFMHLVTAIRGESTDVKLLVKLLNIIFIALRLKKATSLFSMYHFSEEKLERLFLVTSEYWTALTLFGYSPSPSEWSIGKVVVVHAKWMFEKYKVGLGINTMQGREAKHVHIATYSRHSHVRNRWLMIFRHDYNRNIWLPLQEPSLLVYHRKEKSVVPEGVDDSNLYCKCGFVESISRDKWFYCNHKIMLEIARSVAGYKITKMLHSFL